MDKFIKKREPKPGDVSQDKKLAAMTDKKDLPSNVPWVEK